MCTDVRQPKMIFKLLRFSSPIISQFRVYFREIVDLYKGIFARIAKMLSITVLNLLCQFLSVLSMQMSASDLKLNYFRVCGNCRTGFPKHSVSCTLIISLFRIYLREIVDLYQGIFARIAKMLSITVFNLLCQFLSALSMQMSASDLELNYFRVCGNCRTGFSKHSVSCTLIISLFRVYFRETVD